MNPIIGSMRREREMKELTKKKSPMTEQQPKYYLIEEDELKTILQKRGGHYISCQGKFREEIVNRVRSRPAPAPQETFKSAERYAKGIIERDAAVAAKAREDVLDKLTAGKTIHCRADGFEYYVIDRVQIESLRHEAHKEQAHDRAATLQDL